MRASRKPATKKNLFQSDEQDKNNAQIQPAEYAQQKTKQQKKMQRANQIYDPAQIKQNEAYIGREKVQQELTAQKKKQIELSKTKKKMIKNKKKNLFDSDSDDNKQQNQKPNRNSSQDEKKIESKKDIPSIRQKNLEVNIIQLPKPAEKSQKTIFAKKEEQKKQSSNQEQESQKIDIEGEQNEQENTQKQKIKQMVESESKVASNVNGQGKKQVSFSKLVEKAGVDKEQLRNLIYQPIPKGFRAICIFKRIQNGFSETYQLSLQDDERALLYCQNQRGSIGANYYISLTKQMDKKSISYVGKLRGNSTGSVYQLYDNGKQPENNINRRQWRSSMARIQYQSNFLGMNGPRKLKVILPTIKTMQDYDSFKLSESQDLSTFQPPIITKYKNKQPRWNQRLKSYALNFGGRVKQASIKNFILVEDLGNVDQQFNASNCLVFGKIDQNCFSLQAIYPISVYQAFGIVISQFDFKISCE